MDSLDLAPALEPAVVARSFPFHLWLDASLRLQAVGRSLRKALPDLQAGQRLAEQFDVRRPTAAVTADDWRAHGHDLCTLKARGAVPLTLRGHAEVLADGSVLLLVSPVLTALDQVRALGLGFNDFARHDAAGELLLLARTTQMSAADTERLAQRLKQRTALLEAILETSRNGVLAFGANGRLLHGNGPALEMLGLNREQSRGLTLEALSAHVETLMERSQRGRGLLLLQGENQVFRLQLGAPHPSVVEVTLRAGSDGGRLLYWRDMTAESEVDRMKSEFLSTAAHELRTPMVSVHGFTELLLNRPMSAERQRDALQTIHRQSSLLIRMVNELLDLARIESRQGKDLQREPLRLDELVRDSVAVLRGTLGSDAHHQVRVELPHGRARLLLDAAKTAQALTNVLSNAVKYSPQGGQIRVSSIDGMVDGHPAVGLQVSDPGIGMTPEQVARAFERFYRADPSGNIPGTGLGMSLVKEIVELQGGRVGIESQHGKGTTVTLWFPVPDASPLTQPDDGTAPG